MDCSLPGSSVRGILPARILEWVAVPFSRGTLEYMCLFQLWFPWCVRPVVGLLSCMVGLVLVFNNLHTVLHSGYVNFHPHQQCKRVAFSPRPLQHLLSVDFLVMAILTHVRRYFIVVLTCISLTMSGAEHLFMGWVISQLCVFFGERSV